VGIIVAKLSGLIRLIISVESIIRLLKQAIFLMIIKIN